MFSIILFESSKISQIAGQQHVNGHLRIKKRFSLFQDFLHIFLDFLQPVHLATLKTVLCCFGEVCKSYCLFGSDWKKTGWTKLCHTTIVHLWHHWCQHTSFYHDCWQKSQRFLQKSWSFFSLSFHGSTIRLRLLLEYHSLAESKTDFPATDLFHIYL